MGWMSTGLLLGLLLPGLVSGAEVTAVSYNIHEGKDFEQVATTLLALRGDVVALQEVDTRFPAHGGRDSAAELARRFGLRLCYGKGFFEPGKGEKGQAVLSRFPIRSCKTLKLPAVYDWEKHGRVGSRIALRADLEVEGQDLRVYNTHLENRATAKGRAEQLATVLADLEVDPAEMVLLLGDLNTFLPGETTAIRELLLDHELQPLLPKGANTACFCPVCFELDWLALRGAAANQAEVHALSGSDHRPVSTKLSLP